MAKIVISVGHTPNDPGAKFGDLTEFDLASKIAAETVNILKAEKYEVYAVPNDLDLAGTIGWINGGDFSSSDDDICIDIHVNDGGGSGIEGWHRDRGENKSKQLTSLVVDSIAKETGLPSLGAKSEFDHPFKFLAFVHNTNCVSALVECGFMDNSIDSALLKAEDGIRKFARGIVAGIKEFLAKVKDTPASTAVAPAQPVITQPQVAHQTSLPQPRSQQPLAGFGPSGGLGQNDFGFGAPFGVGGVGTAGGFGANPRREMLSKLYRQILGREPDMKGTSYYLYTNHSATEDQIRKEMTESTEHLDLVKNAHKADQSEKRVHDLEEEVSIARSTIEAKDNEIANLQKLLTLKNDELYRAKSINPEGSPANELNLSSQSVSQVDSLMPSDCGSQELKETKPRGCFGWIRGLLGI